MQRTTRALAALCCLLVLLPTLSVRAAVQRSSLQESTEEPRQTNEEERVSEDLLASRFHGRRSRDDYKSSPCLASHRGINRCGHASGGGPSASCLCTSTHGEHHLRNGIGAPLRC